MVTPLNARSVSHQAIHVCGSVGEKQKVQMRALVLAHSHHVSHEIKQRTHALCTRVQSVFISVFLSVMYVVPEGVCSSNSSEENYIEGGGWEGGRQTHKHTFSELLTYNALFSTRCNPNWQEVGFCLWLFIQQNTNRSCQLLVFASVATSGLGSSEALRLIKSTEKSTRLSF